MFGMLVIRVLIADDQALVRGGFHSILAGQDDIEVVGEAEDGNVAVELTERLRPDVVLMDIRMPGIDGIEATRRIAARGLATRVLVLTTFDVDDYVYEAMKAGASGFLLKTAPPRQLTDGVRTVAQPATRCSRPRSRGVSSNNSSGDRPREPPCRPVWKS
jgi:DNA-binding NarL/FixJ family response regulator